MHPRALTIFHALVCLVALAGGLWGYLALPYDTPAQMVSGIAAILATAGLVLCGLDLIHPSETHREPDANE